MILSFISFGFVGRGNEVHCRSWRWKDKKVDETVEIDTEKETEAIHVPDNGDTDPGAPGEVDAIFDFKQVRNTGGLGGLAPGRGGKGWAGNCWFFFRL